MAYLANELGMLFRASDYVNMDKYLPLRHVGDALAGLVDCVSNASNVSTDDLMTELRDNSIELNTVKELAESGVSAAAARFWSACVKPPEWLDDEKMRLGQHTLMRYPVFSTMTLLVVSLAGGYSAPLIIETLLTTNYLAGGSAACPFIRAKTAQRRVFETSQLVSDVLVPNGLLPIDGIGWKTIIQVRLLHARVRYSLLKNRSWNLKKFGLPINQFDMMLTLLAFSTCVIWTLCSKFRISLSAEECESITHLWRVVGYYSGVSESNNPLSQGDRQARVFLQSIMAYMCPSPALRSGIDPRKLRPGPTMSSTEFQRALRCKIDLIRCRIDPLPVRPSSAPSHRLLWPVSNATGDLTQRLFYSMSLVPRSSWTLPYYVFVSRWLLGDAWADALELPHDPFSVRLSLHSLNINKPISTMTRYRLLMVDFFELQIMHRFRLFMFSMLGFICTLPVVGPALVVHWVDLWQWIQRFLLRNLPNPSAAQHVFY